MEINKLFLCPVCKNIPLDERDVFVKSLSYSTKKILKGDIVANQGDIIETLFVLISGSVKTEMISESGTKLYIETIFAPNPLAAAFLFAENNFFPVDVIAVEDCEVIFITKKSIMNLLSQNVSFLQAYMSFNSNRINFLSERLKLLSVKTIKGKLSQYILLRSKGMCFELDKNQTRLAEYFGVTRPSLARSLSEMINDNIISLSKGKGNILNLNALKELIIR